MARLALLLSLVAFLALAPLAWAAPAKMISIPDELFRLVTGLDPESELLVGSVPPDLRERIGLPDDVRVIGTALRQRGAQVFATTSVSEAEIRTAIVSRLQELGWEQAPESAMARGGFQGSRGRRGLQFCRSDDQRLTADVRPWGESTLVTMTLYEGFFAGGCGGHGARPSMADDEVNLHFPTLTPPDGATIQPGGGGSGGGARHRYRSETAEVRTKLSPAALVQHFSAQFREQGWRLDSEAPIEQGVAQIWTFRRDDTRLHGSLIAIQHDPGIVLLEIRASRLR